MSTKDALGQRMKRQYEQCARTFFPRRTYVIIRIDGRAFHSYCKGLARPFDADFSCDMGMTATALCGGIQGARFAYVQSDEISILVTDFDRDDTDAWFDYNQQKMVSISASLATGVFNQRRLLRKARSWLSIQYPDFDLLIGHTPLAQFDSRAFVIPDRVEVENYFIWRQQDATRNSISMAAQSMFSHNQLLGVSSDQMQEMMHRQKGVNWNDYPEIFKRGQVIRQVERVLDVTYTDKRTQETKTIEGVTRRVWQVEAPPVFTRERGYLDALIPRHS